MSIKIKSLKLENYCGYRDSLFDFTDIDGSIKPIALLFGPNGDGKSNLLYGIDVLGNVQRHSGRDTTMLFRKMTFHPDYNPTYEGFYASSESMRITGVFCVENENEKRDAEVLITTKGVEKNELPIKDGLDGPSCHTYLIDADKESERRKFLLHAEKIDQFRDLAKIVYDCNIGVGNEIVDLYGTDEAYYTNFWLEKHDGSKVHFKRMSDGERKIAKLLTSLCDPIWMPNIDIIMIDNIAMHIYFKRHKDLMDKLLDTFPEKQFVATTHSGIIVEHIDKNFCYDIERYKKDEIKRLGKVNPDKYSGKNLDPDFIDRLVLLSQEIDNNEN